MRAKKIMSVVLVMVLLASAVPMAVIPAGAQQAGIPFAGEDNELTKDELVNAILPYMLDEGDFKLDDVGDVAYVYAYWNGVPKTVEDGNNVVSTFYRPPERIVVAYVLYYMPLQTLNAVDRVVAYSPSTRDVSAYNIMYPAFVGLPSVGTGGVTWNIDHEALLKAQPDLLFMMQGGAAIYNRVKELNPDSAVFRLTLYNTYNRTATVENYGTLGYLLDKEEEAEDFIDYYEGFMEMIDEKGSDIPEEGKPRVYYEGRFGSYTKTNSEMIIAAGGNDIFGGAKGSQVTAEDVIRLDPEVIFKSAKGGGYEIDDITTKFKNVRDEIMNRDELQNVTAVKTGRVYVISTTIDCCGAAGGRYFIAIPYIAKALYPDIDLDSTALHQEFLTRFQGVDYDLSKHGTFVYHPEQFPEGR